MDVSFTNVLEGARQYFQGLPTATGQAVSPSYPTASGGDATNQQQDRATPLDRSQQQQPYWQSKQELQSRPPTRDRAPLEAQRPPSHHSDQQQRPPSHNNNVQENAKTPTSYQNIYQDGGSMQTFQFQRPQSRELQSGHQQQYQGHIMQNPNYHQQQSPVSPQRAPSRHESQASPTPSYHQLQPPQSMTQQQLQQQQQQHQLQQHQHQPQQQNQTQQHHQQQQHQPQQHQQQQQQHHQPQQHQQNQHHYPPHSYAGYQQHSYYPGANKPVTTVSNTYKVLINIYI